MGKQGVELTLARRSPSRALNVALVTMPFASAARPSIQIALLAGYTRRAGHLASTFHFNLDLAARMEPDLYKVVCEQRGDIFLGEWLFAEAAFGADAPPIEETMTERLRSIAELGERAHFFAELTEVREEIIPAYLDDLVAGTDWCDYDVVGFSSTFQQNNASFALAHRIKEINPDLISLFGGANFETGMGTEYVRSAPMVDVAICGEADESLALFLTAVANDDDFTSLPGVITRRNGNVVATEPDGLFTALDDQPELDYDDYFERAERLGIVPPVGRREIDLPFESSRGCWWGAKRHCTFCGLNGGSMTYRSKSPGRVVTELTNLAKRYRSFHVEAVDNIVDTAYLKTVFPLLEGLETDLDIFYEVKADLSREDLRKMRRAGVTRIQPGIESLSSHVLALMRKGTRAAWNVNVLRWGRYYGIAVAWNLLYGFPSETEEDYREQEELMSRLLHLEPPTGPGRIWMERFSPIYSDRERFPAKFVSPSQGYRDVYPDWFDLEACAYFFDYELENTLDQSVYAQCHKTIERWQTAWQAEQRPALNVWRMPGFIQIDDHREPDDSGTYTFEGPMAELYLSVMDKALRPSEILEKLGWSEHEARVTGLLDEFCEAGLMMSDRNLYLALALPAKTPT